jgi:UDP-N-acetylmuramyl pentapeptide phosphotransferase/UDP-N-acetylglucosamine-1-phosphate transferase
MSGFEFVDKIKKEEKKKVMPIIIGTAMVAIILVLVYFVLPVSIFVKNLTWVFLLLTIMALMIALYRAYYR